MDIGSIKLQQVAAEIQKVISDDREIIQGTRLVP